ncbi:MAG: class I SAM-dependent methyltransferase [Burkholderiaceae bacterium]
MRRIPWPLPALLAWGAAWAAYWLVVHLAPSQPWSPLIGAVLGIALGLVLSMIGQGWWRRSLIAAGFPLSLVLSGVAVLPPWAWLLLLVLLALVYPLNAWRDAPLFPTPAHALRQLTVTASVQEGALILDAGCGLGHGLMALREAYPQARLHGVERSWPLWAWCVLRCPWARVRRGDMWKADWGSYALVYLFQRPESMPRALSKAQASMRSGTWLVSLEFEARDATAHATLALPDGRALWVYRLPLSKSMSAQTRVDDEEGSFSQGA